MTFNIFEIVGPYCVVSDDGERLSEQVATELSAGRCVELDFSGVKDVISAFLNPAIGSLYGRFPKDFISANLRLTGLDETDAEIVEIVRERAIRYFESDEPRQDAMRNASRNAVEA